jgi:hypothetical protein
MRHEDPPVLKAELAKKVEYTTGPGGKTYKKVIPRTKDKDYRATVFSKFDAIYEKAINDPNVQRHMKKKKALYIALGAVGGIALRELGHFLYESVPKVIEIFQHLNNQ